MIPLVLGPFVQTGVYDLPLVHFEVKSVMTNTAPVGAYRGAGRPEAVFIVERLMDAAARQIGIDPRTIRKVNYIKPAQLPYTNAVGQVYDSGAFAHMLSRASELADWDGFAARKKAAKKKGLLYGRGLTSYIEWTGGRAHTEKVSLHAEFLQIMRVAELMQRERLLDRSGLSHHVDRAIDGLFCQLQRERRFCRDLFGKLHHEGGKFATRHDMIDHALARRPEHFALKRGALRRTNQAWYLQHPGWRVGTNGCLQFCAIRAATASHQRVDQWQKGLIGPEPFGAAPAQQIDAPLRQPVHRHLDKGRLSDPRLSGDKRNLPLAAQHALRHPVQHVERSGAPNHVVRA